jgi:hypothetical protein
MAAVVHAATVTGMVTGLDTGEPLAAATVRVEGTGRTTLTNDGGVFRVRLDPGTYRLRISHVAYHSQWIDLELGTADTAVVAALEMAILVISGARVTEYIYDEAQEIILQAIARKERVLSMIEKYEFEAYTKLVVCDTSKADSNSVLLIAESQVSGIWEHPDHYSETILARKQTSNIDPEGNLMAIGEVLNFNKNRVDIGDYSVVSPVARDALKHYNYYLIDTVFRDDMAIFRLGIEPKDPSQQLFVGTVDIVDSVYAVVGVDVGFSEGFDWQMISDLRYGLQYSRFEQEFWMPVEVKLYGVASVPIFGTFSFDYVAAPHNYRFEPVIASDAFDYLLTVDPAADDHDSAAWLAGQTIPLTDMEERGYVYRDSLESVTPAIPKRMLQIATGLLVKSVFNPTFFHFNRVEGPYLGYAKRKYLGRATSIDLQAGYAFDADRFQHSVSWTQRLWNRRRLDLTVGQRHLIKNRPTLISPPGFNSTVGALFNKTDPLDYYREEGFGIDLSGNLLRPLRLSVAYDDAQQYSETTNTEYSFLRSTKKYRTNPAIDEGHLRSFSARLTYDSRPLIKLKHGEQHVGMLSFTQIVLGAEKSDPGWAASDFDYDRYWVDVRHTRSLFDLGTTSLRLYAGDHEGELPVQRLYTVDFGDEMIDDLNFKSLGESGYSGDRVALAYGQHDFGRRLWRASGLPIVRDIPFAVGIHGGVFVTEFAKGVAPDPAADEPEFRTFLQSAPVAYSELGVSIGQITPFGLRLYFTWQLSDYDTNDFTLHFALGK